MQEFIEWIKANYQIHINEFEIKLLLNAAQRAGIKIDTQTRTALVLLQKQNNLTPDATAQLFLDAQSQSNSANFVDELIDTTVARVSPKLDEAAFLAKAEIAVRFMEKFNSAGVGEDVQKMAEQTAQRVQASLDSRKARLTERFNRILNPQTPATVDKILLTGKKLVGDSKPPNLKTLNPNPTTYLPDREAK